VTQINWIRTVLDLSHREIRSCGCTFGTLAINEDKPYLDLPNFHRESFPVEE
jgi:hypothetical protein